MGSGKPNISASELAVLEVLWDRGPAKARAVFDTLGDRGCQWTYATVLTLLRRLEAKGYAQADKSEFAHVFRASLSRENLLWQRLRGLADRFCGGTTAPMILALVKGRRPSSDEIRQVRRVLDELEREGREKDRLKPKPPGKNAG